MTIQGSPICLPMLMYLSIDFSASGLCHELHTAERRRRRVLGENLGDDAWMDIRAGREEVDEQIATCINTISASCPLLRTFALHPISADCAGVECECTDFVQATLETCQSRTQHTLNALKNLKVRDASAIIAVATDDGYTGVRNVIAPLEMWETLNLKGWPSISLTPDQAYKVMELLCEGPGAHDDGLHIKMWYYQPVGLESPDSSRGRPSRRI